MVDNEIIEPLGLYPDEEETRAMQQYFPWGRDHGISSLTKQTIEEEKKPSKKAKKAVEFAKTFLNQECAYSLDGGHQETNPLLEEPPYKMNNASFVFWCFHQARVGLRGGELNHTIQTIKNDFRFQTVGRIGSTKSHEVLSEGDIVFFNHDKHIGIYTGDGKFISFIGNGENNYSGGVRENDMTQGKWFKYYQGHAMRHKGGTGD